MFALPFMRRRGGGSSIVPGTYATPQDVAAAIAQLIGGAPPVTLDTLAEIAAQVISNGDSLAAISAAIAMKQPVDPKLSAFAALALAADKLIYATGGNTLATTNLTAFARTVLAAVDAAGARAAIGATSQTAFDALSTTVGGKQAQSAKLDAIAASPAPTATGLGLLAAADSAAARALINAQSVIANGTYQTPAEVDAKVAAAKADIYGNIDDATLDTFREVADRLKNDESNLTALTNVVAGKQAKSSFLDKLVAAFTGVPTNTPNQLMVFYPGDASVGPTDITSFGLSLVGKGATGEAGKVYYNSGNAFTGALSITTTATSRAVMSRQPAAVGEIVFATDLVGGIEGFVSNAFSRALIATAAPAANRVLGSDGANPTSFPTGTVGRAIMAAETKPDAINASGAQAYSIVLDGYIAQAIAGSGNEFPYFSASGVIARTAITAYARSFLAVSTAQAAKAQLDIKARFFSRTTNLAIVANTPTELTFDTTAAVTGYTVADVALASGRVQASNAGSVLYRPYLTLTVDGPIDLDFLWSKQSTAGVASTEGMLLPTKTRRTFAAADTRVIEVPGPFLMLAGGNEAQLKIVVTSPTGATTQNITSAKLMLVEG